MDFEILRHKRISKCNCNMLLLRFCNCEDGCHYCSRDLLTSKAAENYSTAPCASFIDSGRVRVDCGDSRNCRRCDMSKCASAGDSSAESDDVRHDGNGCENRDSDSAGPSGPPRHRGQGRGCRQSTSESANQEDSTCGADWYHQPVVVLRDARHLVDDAGTQIFPVHPIISRTGKATNFKFGRYIHRVPANKNPLRIWEKRERWRIQGLSNFLIYPLLSQERVKLRTSNLASIFRGFMRTNAL